MIEGKIDNKPLVEVSLRIGIGSSDRVMMVAHTIKQRRASTACQFVACGDSRVDLRVDGSRLGRSGCVGPGTG
jgi:hypothetical protein